MTPKWTWSGSNRQLRPFSRHPAKNSPRSLRNRNNLGSSPTVTWTRGLPLSRPKTSSSHPPTSGNARRLALEIISAWQGQSGPASPFLDELLARTLAAHPQLSRPDQALLRELATGILRWRGRLDYAIAQAARRPVHRLHPLVLDLLRLCAYQLFFLDRIPASAALNESVKLARARRLPPALIAFVNAVGRTLAAWGKHPPLPDPAQEPVAALAAAASLPDWLAARWLADLGWEQALARAQASNRHPPLTIRTNTMLASPETLQSILSGEGVVAAPCRYSPWGLNIVSLEQSPLSLPSYQRGLWLFQDEAAQLATLLLQARPGHSILEMGAGRGGKTTHLAQILQGSGKIIALDASLDRLQALSRQLSTMALTGAFPVQADGTRPLPFPPACRFDRILMDAPCSGLGVLRRHPELRWRRQPGDFARFAAIQRRLLDQAAPNLRPGGILLYITCTTEAPENEEVIQAFLAAQPGFALANPEGALPSPARQFINSEGYFRTLPEEGDLDGFFAAALLKKA